MVDAMVPAYDISTYHDRSICLSTSWFVKKVKSLQRWRGRALRIARFTYL